MGQGSTSPPARQLIVKLHMTHILGCRDGLTHLSEEMLARQSQIEITLAGDGMVIEVR